MDLHNKKAPVTLKVTMPSGRLERVTLPTGEFDLPNSYVIAIQALPNGPAVLKSMKPRKRKTNDVQTDSQDKSKSGEGS